MASKRIVKQISPSLHNDIVNLQITIKNKLGREIGYKQACKVYSKIMRAKSRDVRYFIDAKRLSEILGSPDE